MLYCLTRVIMMMVDKDVTSSTSVYEQHNKTDATGKQLFRKHFQSLSHTCRARDALVGGWNFSNRKEGWQCCRSRRMNHNV